MVVLLILTKKIIKSFEFRNFQRPCLMSRTSFRALKINKLYIKNQHFSKHVTDVFHWRWRIEWKYNQKFFETDQRRTPFRALINWRSSMAWLRCSLIHSLINLHDQNHGTRFRSLHCENSRLRKPPYFANEDDLDTHNFLRNPGPKIYGKVPQRFQQNIEKLE